FLATQVATSTKRFPGTAWRTTALPPREGQGLGGVARTHNAGVRKLELGSGCNHPCNKPHQRRPTLISALPTTRLRIQRQQTAAGALACAPEQEVARSNHHA